MSNTQLSTLVPLVRVRRCPDNLILQALRSACVDFLTDTEVWREKYGNIATVADQADYNLTPAYSTCIFKRIAMLERDGVEYHSDLWSFSPDVAQNILLYSNTLSNASWAKTDATVSDNTVTLADGAGQLSQTVTVTASTLYTFSFYAKRGTLTAANYHVYDDTNSADIVASTSYYSMTRSSEYVRVSVSFTTPATCTSIIVSMIYSPAVTGTIYLKNAQLETGGLSKYFGTTSVAENGADTYFLTLDPIPSTSGDALMPHVVYVSTESTTEIANWVIQRYGRFIARKAEYDLKSDPQSDEHPVPWFSRIGAQKAYDEYLDGVYRAKEDVYTQHETGNVAAEMPPFFL